MDVKERKARIIKRLHSPHSEAKSFAKTESCDKLTPELKLRLDDALRRLHTAAEDIKEIRRFLQAA